jgi:phosphonate transport system substrate-binding protein
MESDAAAPLANQKLPRPERTHPILLMLTAFLLAAFIGIAIWLKFYRMPTVENSAIRLASAGFSNTAPHTLDPAFKDANGDLIADPPSNPAQFIDPPTLTFCYIASDDAAAKKQEWKPFTEYLSKVTGKPVDYLLVTSTHDEIKAMHDGQLQVAGFNTGAVPPAVNVAGFVPICALPTSDGGAFTHTDIIVPADSPLQKPEDLKGHELTLTSPDSNSGYKAPLALLRSNYGLQPSSDISLRCSLSHDASIAGVVSHKYEAAAVADDMLGRQLSAGTISPTQFRIIYKSENFPTAGLGYVYNLKPELANKVREALLSFDWKGTPLEKVLNAGPQTKFVQLDYKKDWGLVRHIDDQMGLLSGF